MKCRVVWRRREMRARNTQTRKKSGRIEASITVIRSRACAKDGIIVIARQENLVYLRLANNGVKKVDCFSAPDLRKREGVAGVETHRGDGIRSRSPRIMFRLFIISIGRLRNCTCSFLLTQSCLQDLGRKVIYLAFI